METISPRHAQMYYRVDLHVQLEGQVICFLERAT